MWQADSNSLHVEHLILTTECSPIVVISMLQTRR